MGRPRTFTLAKKVAFTDNKIQILPIIHMKDFLTPEFVAAFFGLLRNPSTYAWAILIVVALFGLAHLCTSLAELVKLFK